MSTAQVMIAQKITSGGGGGLTLLALDNIPFGSANTTHAVPMPATVNAGDLLILMLVFENTSVTTPSGWTKDVENNNAMSDVKTAIFSKIAAGTEGGTSVNFTLGLNRVMNSVRLRYSGSAATGYLEYAFVEINNVASIDPANLSPTWGSADNGWITLGSSYQDTRTVVQYPLPDNNARYTGVSHCNIHTATKMETAASIDPDNLILNAADFGTIFTIGIQPA